MLVTVADNQWILRQDPGVTVYTSDPVEIGANDRATAILVAHSLFGGAIPADRAFSYVCQVSLDGVNWLDRGPADGINDAAQTPSSVTGEVHATYIRFQFRFTMSVAGLGGALFDLKVLVDRA